ncbi:putative d-mandelate dehydrogenase [Phlyctema vagabunda]|uniref:D-mandelate dehydrogenase n=1 Tax=Phlyctema vagabunda TaxID=108571 RepID=A0ABR4PD07_9HELO
MILKPIILYIPSSVRTIDEEQWARIQSKFNIITYDCANTDEFIRRLQEPDGHYSKIQAIIRTGWLKAEPFGNQKFFRGEVLQHFPPSLKLIAVGSHGYDAADVAALTAMGVWYCNAPDTFTEAVANTALHLILNTFRYFTFAEHVTRAGRWDESRVLGKLAVDPSGQVLGIVGMGDIGIAIASRAVAFGMKVHYFNRRRLTSEREASVAGGAVYHSSLESLLRISDCICLACPYTPETHHMLSTAQFELAKKQGLRVVNIARGGLIDEAALLKAMESGKVIGVGLDVHENEPGINPALKDNYMTTVLPHFGVCSQTSWLRAEQVTFDNLEEFFYGGKNKPLTPVNHIS